MNETGEIKVPPSSHGQTFEFKQPQPGPDGRVTLFDFAVANTTSSDSSSLEITPDGFFRLHRKTG